MSEFAEFLRSLNAGDVGFATLLGLAIWSIITGRLVPRSHVEDLRADRDAQVMEKKEEAQTWREAYQLSTSATSEVVKQNEKLIDQMEVVEHLLRSIQERGKQ